MTDPTGAALDPCGCCEGEHVDPPLGNPPALPALAYRIGTHARFLERMLHALPRVPEATAPRPLERLTARTTDDATVALLDASATVADILTFYQERIANEGFLRTATERRSVLELARAIGYELAPGVAAGVYLAFTIDDSPGSPGRSEIPRGTQVQSVPPAGKLPQVFETSGDFVARAEWNALRPRLTRRAELAIAAAPGGTSKRLYLLGPAGTFPPGTAGLRTGLNPEDLHRLDATPPSASTVDAIEVSRVYLTEAASGLAKGDLILLAGKRGQNTDVLVLRAAEVEAEPSLKRIRVDLEALPQPATPALSGLRRFPYVTAGFGALATVRLGSLALNRANLAGAVLTQTWRERDLRAFMGIHGWQASAVARAVNARPAPEPEALEAGAFGFGERAGFFGHNAPKWGSLPATNTKGNPYPNPWDAGDGTTAAPLAESRTIWTDSQGNSTAPHVHLERPVKGVTSGTWTVFESADVGARAYSVDDAREVSRADFGISGRATRLALRDTTGALVSSTGTLPALRFRESTAHLGSRRLEFAELPIDTPIDAGATAVELDRMVLDLTPGQPVALAGERHDLPGTNTAEIAFLADVVHAGGRTTLLFSAGLEHSYVRSTLTISANVAHATHGESVSEVLGGGDGTVSNQTFALKKPPLTYVSAPTPRGVRSTLEIRVNRVRWDEVPSLYGIGPERQAYVVRLDDDARAHVTFGDGEHGARVPSGAANVTASYRSGIGPDGEVDAGTLTILRTIPLGLRGVANPLPASGAEGPERSDNARRNAPLTVLTFERIVSLLDYEDFARTFPGIGKALVDRLWVDGRDVVHVTVGGATGGAPGAGVIDNLRSAIDAASDRSQRFEVSPFALRYFTVRAKIAVDPRYVAADVLAGVEAGLRAAFAFDARDFGQSVTPSEVIALVHGVAGVVAVDLDELAPYTEEASATARGVPPFDPIVALRARWNAPTRTFEPAHLLLVNPVGIALTEMTG